ncbi:UDP-2,3-diacylglucosamine diphosphatase [Providencia hangzhouensis]|uniref:UDP-2,3-diacylglucosamine hydrolase n=1 Tax=Providencia rettgeri TaxID=587 RepID=A0A9N8D4U5_PRORE|nr:MULTISPECIES: UDP-2,3-diacylglucosamine diphosphatase [Providencia]MBN6363954.1 UDP-2,3-diacylglucosamine diphosphatase [Providencia rettgeri]MBN7842752.1 UDP-2,3-diacylglucosamine diphosphatase [Providencia rettgeri]MBN7854053.1 UDP-2,3-diacylglucosamine diphosphatase [Providencia rettgeri]MBN7861068.1 UDP-2,3-diacylglucosamine diphosphatase [Providencia rettgeri]MBN7870965.1 UDP-2,3-diacylglucosamine diphosphatase [Providencia rettgeri]
MSTYIIADLHLSEDEPAITAGFINFIQQQAIHAESLYILGDFFNYWVGDDDDNPLHQQVANELKQLTDRGIPCYFIHGNRDFLIGQRYAKQCGMTILPQETLLELYGKRILILHGDTLCIDDAAYQNYRKKVHTPWVQRLFLLLPLFVRRRIAQKMRQNSQYASSMKAESIMDVNSQAVIDALQRHQAQWMIHGHTHRPAIHEVNIGGKLHYRGVLGAWHYEGSAFVINEQGIELIFFPFE